jgi:uncharacterized protein
MSLASKTIKHVGKCQFPLIFVTWLDHAGSDGKWKDVHDVDSELSTVYSVGWLVKETKYVVVLAPTLADKGNSFDCNDDCVIAKNAICQRIVLVGARR